MTEPTETTAARKLRDRAPELARRANEAFLERHPEWLERFGDRARTHGEEDARFHLEFLASAVEMDSPGSFADYVRWTISVLESRGMRRDDLDEHLDDLLDAMVESLTDDELATVRSIVDEGRARAGEQGQLEWREEPEGDLAATRRLFTQAVIRGNRTAATNLVDEALRAGAHIQDIFIDVLQASQYEVGERWQANEISVAQEHMATAVTQNVIALLFAKLDIPEHKRGTVVITGVAGEQHHLGGRMVADILETEGWDVRFIGTQLPHSGILEVIAEEEPTIVGISATMTTNLPSVASLLSDISDRFGADRPALMVGGRAFLSDGNLWKRVGADRMGRDLRDALGAARELTG